MRSRPHDGAPDPAPLAVLVPIYVLSGLCSLVYETAWIARFSLVFGSTIWGTSVVVAVFFGGLAAGSRWFGRVAQRAQRPVRLYAALEVAIGLWALAFPVLMNGAEHLYATLVFGDAPSSALLLLLRVAVACALLLPPTVLMGGTLPVILRVVMSSSVLTRRRAALLYGANAIGAALGASLTGLVLLRFLGINRSVAAAALLNIGLGLVAARFAKAADGVSQERALATGPAETTAAGAAIPATLALFAVSGFVSMSLEIVWLRHLTFFFRDTVHLYTGIITFFVLGIGCGSLAAGYRRQPLRQPVHVLGLLLAGIGLSAVLVTWTPILVADALTAIGSTGALSLWLVIGPLLLVPTAFMGATFPVVSRIVGPRAERAAASIGLAYALNTAGSIAGILFGGFALFPLLGLHRGVTTLVGLELLAAATLLWLSPTRGKRLAAITAMAAIAVPLVLESGIVPRIPHALIRGHLGAGHQVLEIREGATSTASVVRTHSGELQLIDGSVVIGREKSGFPVVQGFVPLLLADTPPTRVLSLAFGAGLSTYGMRLLPEVQTLDLVDISRENVELAIRHFPETRALADDPRARFVFDDAYNYLKYSDRTHDLIFVEPTPPMYSFRNAALYTREFYRLARARLTDGGIFAQVLPLAQLSPKETLTVLRTFASVYESCALWWNHTDAVLLGARRSLVPDGGAIARRLARPEVSAALRRYSGAGFWRLESFLAGWLLDDAGVRAAAGDGPLYTDDRLELKYTTGGELSPEGIRRILAHAVEDSVIARVLAAAGSRHLLASLLRQRGRLLALTYSAYPETFVPEFRRYMERFPAGRAADLRLLHRYLTEKGQLEAARGVEAELRQLGVSPTP